MTDAVRKALIDLMDDVDKHSVHADVWEQAKAALAAPPAERPPAVTISALLHPAYEPGDGSADGAQMVEMAWWHPVMGCDSLQIVVDNARAALAQPEPERGMILAGYIHRQGNHWELSERPLLDDEIKRGWVQEPVYRAALPPVEPEVVGPSDEELLATLNKATADFPPRHPEAESLNAVEYPLALELRKARAVLARFGAQR